MDHGLEFDKSDDLTIFPYNFKWESSSYLSEVLGFALDLYDDMFSFYIRYKHGCFSLYVLEIEKYDFKKEQYYLDEVIKDRYEIYRFQTESTGWECQIDIEIINKFVGHIIRF